VLHVTSGSMPDADVAEAGDLVRRGLVSGSEVVEGAVALHPVGGRRSGNVGIERPSGRSLFVKRSGRGSSPARLAHEAAVSRHLQGPVRGPMAGYLPECLADPAQPDVLVAELLTSAIDLAEHHAGGNASSGALGRAVGGLLATLHGLPVDAFAAGLDSRPPPVFALADPDLELYCSLSAANLACLAEAQEAGTCALLAKLAADWTPRALIHGDVRLANLMVEEPLGAAPRIWLVDWEDAAHGDPGWDVGCLLAHHVSLWLTSLPRPADLELGGEVERAGRPLETLQPYITEAWGSYRAARGLGRARARAELAQAIRFAGAALVEIALALGQDGNGTPSRGQLRHLQVAHNVLSRPVEAAVQLMGFSLDDVWEVA